MGSLSAFRISVCRRVSITYWSFDCDCQKHSNIDRIIAIGVCWEVFNNLSIYKKWPEKMTLIVAIKNGTRKRPLSVTILVQCNMRRS